MQFKILSKVLLAIALIASTSGHAETIGRFHVKQGIATDSVTGLSWMRCPLGMKWAGDTCSGKPTLYTWDEALQTPKGFSYAGHKDWRVPTVDELKTLIDQEARNKLDEIPYINSLVFPNTVYVDNDGTTGSWYWSSSPSGYSSDNASFVPFGNGVGEGTFKYNQNAVRLVRTGQ